MKTIRESLAGDSTFSLGLQRTAHDELCRAYSIIRNQQAAISAMQEKKNKFHVIYRQYDDQLESWLTHTETFDNQSSADVRRIQLEDLAAVKNFDICEIRVIQI